MRKYQSTKFPLRPGWARDSISLIYCNIGYDQVARIRSHGKGKYRIEFNGSRQSKKFLCEEQAMVEAEKLCDTPPQRAMDRCPECGHDSVVAQRSGGVKCTTIGCHYWFCY